MLSYCPAKAGKCAWTLHTPTALLSSSATSLKLAGLGSPHGKLLDYLALVAMGDLHSWVPQNCNNQRDSSWEATNPRALHRQQTEIHPQSLCDKSLFTYLGASASIYPGASASGGGFQFATHLEATEVLSGKVGQGMLP